MIRALQTLLKIPLCFVAAAIAPAAFAAGPGVVDTTSSPHAQVRTLGMSEAH